MAVLTRIFVNLFYRFLVFVYYPLTLLKKNAFGVVIMVGFAYILSLFMFGEEEEKNTQQNFTQQPVETVIQAVAKHEDGNSKFASDLYKSMTPEELQYYSQTFNWVMGKTKDGETKNWNFYNIHGAITPTSSFKNNMGHSCRRFKETLKVHDIQQTLDAQACRKAGGGWCKLRRNSTPVCGLNSDGSIGEWWSDATQSLGDWFR